MVSDAQGLQSCTTWQYLQPGQRLVQAATLPAGEPLLCTAVVADQVTGELEMHARSCLRPAADSSLDGVKKRIDVLLVERGLAESRAQAQALLMAGLVPGLRQAGAAGRRDASS